MKKSRKITLTVLCLWAFYSLGYSQNGVWSLPPYYFDFNNYQPLPTGQIPGSTYQGQAAQYCHNAMQDASGNLLFFIVDENVYDKNGVLIDKIDAGSGLVAQGGSDITIVPDPGNCYKYYIFTSYVDAVLGPPYYVHSTPFYSVLDLQTKTLQTYNLKNILDNAFGLPSAIWVKNEYFSYAATDLRYDNSRFVVLSVNYVFFVMQLDAIGLTPLSYYYIPENFGLYAPSGTAPGAAYPHRGELEIIEYTDNTNTKKYKIASSVTLGIQQTVLSQAVFLVDIDYTTGAFIPASAEKVDYPYHETQFNNAPFIHGLEFSPNAEYVYITHSPSALNPSYFDVYQVGSGNPPTVLNVQNAADFSNSRIELGKDGKLYLATTNRLATLSNPNNPNPNNWNNNAIALSNYFPNYASGTFQFYSHRTHLLPDQIDGMDYTAHFNVSKECCIANNSYEMDTFTAPTGTHTWQPGINNNPFGSLSGVVKVKEKLIIPAGSHITIKNMVFEFAPTAQVEVQRGVLGGVNGGRLTLDNATFTVDKRCDPQAMWRGLQVHGYNNQPQLAFNSSKQGWLTMRNQARIEHAITGVAVFKAYPTDFTYSGGIVRATDSYFFNNQRDVDIRNYTNPSPNLSLTNLSQFTKCTFYTSGLLNNPNALPWVHVTLSSVAGVRFYGNTFENETPYTYAWFSRGHGIQAFDAHFIVDAFCHNLTCTAYTPNVFRNMTWGITSIGANTMKTIKCDRSLFINQTFNMSLAGLSAARVTRNTFEVYRSALPNHTNPAHGLLLLGCTGYVVQENSFTEFNEPGITAPGNTYGTLVINSGIADNEIYKNHYFNIKIGGQSQAINSADYTNNYPNIPGLRWKCNDFTDDLFEADLAVTSGRIAYHQGYCKSITNVDDQAGNRFSHSLFTTANDIAVNPGVNPFQYSHHADMITTPIYYSTSFVTPNPCFNQYNPVYYHPTLSCPSKIKSASVVVLGPVMKVEIKEMKEQITQEQNKIDGGNTGYLLQQVASLPNGSLKNLLLQHAPYLSDTVLLAYLAKNPPAGHVQQILLACSPLSPQVLAFMQGMNLPNGIKNQVNNNQTGTNPIVELQSYISFLNSERENLINDLISLYMTDTLVENPIDSVIAILKEENRLERERQLCHIYIIKNDSLAAREVLDTIHSKTGPDDFCKVTDAMLKMLNYSSVCEAMKTNPALAQTIQDVAGIKADPVHCVRAEAILVYIADSVMAPLIEPLIWYNARMAQEEQHTEQALALSGKLNIHPNPADGNTVFLTYAEGFHQAVVEVYGVTGKLLHTQAIQHAGSSVYSLDTSTLPNGMYLVKLLQNNKPIEVTKLVINR